jgi:hypothetical protein
VVASILASVARRREAEERAAAALETARKAPGVGRAGAQHSTAGAAALAAQAAEVQATLAAGAEDSAGPQPTTTAAIVQRVAAAPQLPPLMELPVLRTMLEAQQALHQCIDGARQSDAAAEADARAAFVALLRAPWQLASCPDADTARALFAAVWAGGPELSAAAAARLLAWCGASEAEAGECVCVYVDCAHLPVCHDAFASSPTSCRCCCRCCYPSFCHTVLYL